MPIEIKELIIRATVEARGGGGGERPAAQAPGGGEAQKRQIVAECVEQVMDILRRERER